MTNRSERGRCYGRNAGSSQGSGFRGSSPPWPYVGMGRGGLPRCGDRFRGAGAPEAWPEWRALYSRAATRGRAVRKVSDIEELDYLKNQAEAVKKLLDQIMSKIRDMGTGDESRNKQQKPSAQHE